MTSTRHYASGAMVLLALTASLTACGSSSSSDSASQNKSSSSSQSPGNPATGDPISIGFVNQSQGTNAYPQFGVGAKPAIDYVNNNGGVNGRPIKLDVCETDGSAAASVNCANRFVENKDVAVLMGIDVSSDSALPILQGANIPLIGHVSFGPKQADSPDAYFFGAANDAYYITPLAAMKELGVKSLAFISEDSAFSHSSIETATQPAADKLGLDMTVNYYSLKSPNYTAIFAAAVSKKPDAVFFTSSENDCTGFVSAARTLHYPGKVFAGTCSDFVTHAPDAAEGVYTNSDIYQPDGVSEAPSAKAAEVKIYVDAMKQSHAEMTTFAQLTFAGAMDLVTAMKTITGQIDGPSILKAIGAMKDVSSFTGQNITCDGTAWPKQRAICSTGLLTYQVKDGKQVPVTGYIDGSPYAG
jgi:branched-chain amino acid transport system substrate-binding protein